MATITERRISQKYDDVNRSRTFQAAAELSGCVLQNIRPKWHQLITIKIHTAIQHNYFYPKRLQLLYSVPQVLLGLDPTTANVLQCAEATNGYYPYPHKVLPINDTAMAST
ncbi:hypothetical protein T05_5893 [Trichinella murrelli]|uniref:Uncharacterized protein n=1 Tax=Trichinella murrelli TaxID=144512 RepID=A0A0V0UCP9_9BILA|nr:hypothetical protein T05_5893 [Trichinella murrelli]